MGGGDSYDYETWARAECERRGLKYLSHEVYGLEIWIAVQDGWERYELKIKPD